MPIIIFSYYHYIFYMKVTVQKKVSTAIKPYAKKRPTEWTLGLLRELSSPDIERRICALDLLKESRGDLTELSRHPKITKALKVAVFDSRSIVREMAVNELAERIGWENTIRLIKERFKQPGETPSAFFYDVRKWVGGRSKITRWRESDWRAIREQAIIDARQLHLVRMKDEKGRFFSVMGIPVFLGRLGNLLGKYDLGLHKEGLIVVNKKLKLEDRKATAWHEFGEIFSHKAGNAFESDFYKKQRKG